MAIVKSCFHRNISPHRAEGQPVSALGWDDAGQVPAFGTEDGAAGVRTF